MKKGLLVIQGKLSPAAVRKEVVERLAEGIKLDDYHHFAVAAGSSAESQEALEMLTKSRNAGAKPAFQSDLVLSGYTLKSHQVERLRSFGAVQWDVCGQGLEAEILAASFVLHDAGLNPALLVSHTTTQINEAMRVGLLDLYRKHFGADSVKVGF